MNRGPKDDMNMRILQACKKVLGSGVAHTVKSWSYRCLPSLGLKAGKAGYSVWS